MRHTKLLLIGVALLTLAGMMWCALQGDRIKITILALIFGFAAIWSTRQINAPYIVDPDHTGGANWSAAAIQIRATSFVTASVYAWGGLAMLLIYLITPLHWRHGWQYGSIMLVIAAGLILYIRALSSPSSRFARPASVTRIVQLAILHGITAAIALAWLILSGKLATYKGDWAANAIFLAGGLAIIGISIITVVTHRALTRAPATGPSSNA